MSAYRSRRQTRYPTKQDGSFAFGAKAGCGCLMVGGALFIVIVVWLILLGRTV